MTAPGDSPPGAPNAGRRQAARPRVPAAVFRRVREAYGLTPAELAKLLKLGRATYYRVERPGGPGGSPGLLLALGGLGIARLGLSVAEVAALLGIDPDADPKRTPDGRYAPWTPPADLPPVRTRSRRSGDRARLLDDEPDDPSGPDDSGEFADDDVA